MNWEDTLKLDGPIAATLNMYERMIKELWALADENPNNQMTEKINKITNRATTLDYYTGE